MQEPSADTQKVTSVQFSQVAEAAGGFDDYEVPSSKALLDTPTYTFLETPEGNPETNLQTPCNQEELSLGNLRCSSSAPAAPQTFSLMPVLDAALLSSSSASSCSLGRLSEVGPGCNPHQAEAKSYYNPPRASAGIPPLDDRATHGSFLTFVQADGVQGPAFDAEFPRSDSGRSEKILKHCIAHQGNSMDALSSIWIGEDPVLGPVHNTPINFLGAHTVAESSNGSATLQESTSGAPPIRAGPVSATHYSPRSGTRQSPCNHRKERTPPIATVAGGIHIQSANLASDTTEVRLPRRKCLQSKPISGVY